MTWHEFETAALWFSLGLLAAPFWRLMAEHAAERRAEARALALARGLVALATLPPHTGPVGDGIVMREPTPDEDYWWPNDPPADWCSPVLPPRYTDR